MANDLIERVQSCPTSRINQGPVNLNSTGNPSSAGNLNNIGESGGGVSAWQSLNQSLSSRRQITKDAVEIVTTWVPELAPSSSVLSLDTNSENQAIHWTPQVSMQSAEVNAQLPAGTGFLQFSGKPARCAVELPVSASDLHMQIDGDLVSENSALGSKLAQQSANLAFRGHLYGTPQHSSALELRASSVARKPASKTTLVVNDPFQATHDRTFILDCSSSMFAKAEGSFADPTPDSGLLAESKLEAAKLALLRMLGTLVGSNDRVAVLLYGHRLADGTVEQGKLRQSKYHAKFPFSASLEAAEDVETILPLGRFGFAEYQAVEGRLKEVVPWGQTPLYLAVREAISQASATIEAHDIVVISDGRNYQFNPRPNMAPTLEQVLKSANAKGARLNLIGFGVPAQEQAAALADFKRLAEGTGGLAKLQVSEATELLDQLLSLVQQAPLQIQLPSGEKIVGNVNETIELANVNSLNSELTLSYQDRSSKIAVSRGDAIELNVNRAGLLSAAKYVAGQPKFANLLDARKRASNTLVGIHRPNAVGTAVEWTFSFQSTKAEIVSKPQHLVVQIEPLANGQTSSQQASAACYTYFDPLWQPGFTCPVTKIRTLNWPATASAAKINVWVQAKHRVAQRFSCSLKDLVSAQTANTNSASNKSISGYSIDVQNQGDSLQVLVRGLEEGKSIFDFVPRLSGWETPVKVRQEFIDSRGTSFLSFQFGSDLAAKHLEDIVISFDELEATKRNALGLQQPMIIELQPETDSLAAISQQLRR